MRLLDEETHGRIYEERVRPILFEAATASTAPRLVVVGGQPGAGKTNAMHAALRDLARYGEGAVYINGDELRPFHPRYASLVAEDRSTVADKTGADVGLWVERAIREAAAGRHHAVIETTMRQPDVVRRSAEQFIAQGFRFEMRVVAVHPELSRLAIYDRFNNGLNDSHALPRFTLARYHAEALAAMPKTLEAIGKLAATVRLVDRQGQELYSSASSKVSPSKALADFRRQPLADADRQRIAGRWARLVELLDRDGVPQLVRDGVQAEQARFAAVPRAGRSRGKAGPGG